MQLPRNSELSTVPRRLGPRSGAFPRHARRFRPDARGSQPIHRAQETRHEPRRRPEINGFRSVELLDPPAIHHRQLV